MALACWNFWRNTLRLCIYLRFLPWMVLLSVTPIVYWHVTFNFSLDGIPIEPYAYQLVLLGCVLSIVRRQWNAFIWWWADKMKLPLKVQEKATS